MNDLTDDAVRRLAALRSDQGVTTCYLDIDGSRFVRDEDYQRVFDSMAHRLRTDDDIDDGTDLARIAARVHDGFDRSRTRGVALFSSVADDVWKVVELPVSVRAQLVVDRAPAVSQLEAVLQRRVTIGLLLADRSRARVFVYRFDELIDQRSQDGDTGRDYDSVGEHDRGDVSGHREAMTRDHLRRAAAMLWEAHRDHDIDHVVLGAADHNEATLHEALHPYLRQRLRAPIGVETSASPAEIGAVVRDIAVEIESDRVAELVDRLRTTVGAGGRGVVGLADVLQALNDQRVEMLLVSDGFAASGWECRCCGRLAVVGRDCACGAEMEPVAAIVERAIDRVMVGAGKVEVCTGNADLDVLGRIGAVLHY